MKIYKKSDGYSPSEFLKYGLDHCQTSIDLFSQHGPRAFDSASHLMHLGLEQILKACHLEIYGQFSDTHRLTKLIEGLSNHGINIAPKYKKVFEEIDSYEKIKYPQNVEGPIEVGNENLKLQDELNDNLKLEDESESIAARRERVLQKLLPMLSSTANQNSNRNN